MKPLLIKICVLCFSASLMGCYVSYKAGLIGPDSEHEPIMPSSKRGPVAVNAAMPGEAHSAESEDSESGVDEPDAESTIIMPGPKSGFINGDSSDRQGATNTQRQFLSGSKWGKIIQPTEAQGAELSAENTIIYSSKSGIIFTPADGTNSPKQSTPVIMPSSKGIIMVDPLIPLEKESE